TLSGPGISASTRCGAVPTRSGPNCTSSAPRAAAPWCGSNTRPRTVVMPVEAEEMIRVVVVDDHAVVRRGLFAFLEGEPDIAFVGDADGGAAALELIEQLDREGRCPHVVL